MARMIKVNYKDIEEYEFEAGVTLKEVSEKLQNHYNYPILIGMVDNDITELNEELTRSCKVDFFDRSTTLGNSAYGRTTQFMLVVAVKELYGENVDVVIDFSIDKGYYCELKGVDIDKPDVTTPPGELIYI